MPPSPPPPLPAGAPKKPALEGLIAIDGNGFRRMKEEIGAMLLFFMLLKSAI